MLIIQKKLCEIKGATADSFCLQLQIVKLLSYLHALCIAFYTFGFVNCIAFTFFHFLLSLNSL